MQRTFFLISFAGAMLLCGCDKQTQINMQKIEILSQKIVQLQESQARQMAIFQTQLAALAPMLDKMNNFYFEKNHDEAFFFHTNTLYLLLTVDKKIESQLQVADTEREADSSLAYSYHTNEVDVQHFYAAQIQEALSGQETRIQNVVASQEKQVEDNINAETRQMGASMSNELLKQIKLSTPDTTEIARLKEMAADLAQIKHDLDAIKAQLAQLTNQPAARP